MIKWLKRLFRILRGLHSLLTKLHREVHEVSEAVDESKLMLRKANKAIDTVYRQQEQVRILHDDMATMIKAMGSLERNAIGAKNDIELMAKYLLDHKIDKLESH